MNLKFGVFLFFVLSFFMTPNSVRAWSLFGGCLDDIETSSTELKQCQVHQTFANECDTLSLKKTQAHLECRKEGVDYSKSYAAEQLGESKVNGNIYNSPYAKLLQKAKMKADLKDIMRKSFSSLLTHNTHLRLDMDKHLKNYDTKACPDRFEGGNNNYMLIEKLQVKSLSIDKHTRVPSSTDGVLHAQHLFFQKMQDYFCYYPQSNPINIPIEDINRLMLHPYESTSFMGTHVHWAVPHLCTTDDECNDLIDTYKSLQKKWLYVSYNTGSKENAAKRTASFIYKLFPFK